MQKNKFFYWMLLIWASLSPLFSYSMVYDNRYLPLFGRTNLFVEGLPSSFSFDYKISTASRAFNDDEEEVGLPELFGKFELNQLANGFVAAGMQNPLRSDLQGIKIPFNMDGKIQSQAVAFGYNQQIVPWCSIGFSWMFMRVNSRYTFALGETNIPLTLGEKLEIDEMRRGMFTCLGIQENHFAQLGFGDIDGYLRFGREWDYTLKFRRINAGMRFGVLIPTGERKDLSAPLSIPFGGNGHWGFYINADVLFELKEDIKAGMFFRVSNRFVRVDHRRMSAVGEPEVFGVVTGQARVNPGTTVIFSPYFILESLRQGLGVGVHYTLTSHSEDEWSDSRPNKTTPISLKKVVDYSKWGSDYFTINVFYDFGKVKVKRSFDPIFSLRWDVPALLFMSNRIARTHTISLGMEFAF